MNSATDQIATALTDLEIDLSQFSAHVQRRVWALLRQMQDDVTAQINAADLEGIVRSDWRAARSEALLTTIRVTVEGSFSKVLTAVDRELAGAARLAQESVVDALNDVFTVDIVRPSLTQADLKALVNRQVVLGEPLKDWWAGQSEGTRRRFAREIRLGVAQGETNAQLVRRIRGTSTGKTQTVTLANGEKRRLGVFEGGAMDATTREAETLVRTATQSVSNDVLRQTYAENADLIRGVEALTTLDARTSVICMARTGAAWDLDGNALPESTVKDKFPGYPPWHPNCRTTLVPVLKTWDDLIEEQGGQRLGLLETVSDSTRASMDGQITSSMRTFDDWLKAKGDVFARAKLGAGRFDLWRSGQISTRDLIDQRGNPRSIEEILEARGIARAS